MHNEDGQNQNTDNALLSSERISMTSKVENKPMDHRKVIISKLPARLLKKKLTRVEEESFDVESVVINRGIEEEEKRQNFGLDYYNNAVEGQNNILEVKEESKSNSYNNSSNTNSLYFEQADSTSFQKLKVKSNTQEVELSVGKEKETESFSAFQAYANKTGIKLKKSKTAEIKDKHWFIRLSYFMKKHFLRSKPFGITMTIAILIDLFIDDIKIIFLPYYWDFYIYIIIGILYVMSIIEMLGFLLFVRSYRFSFFFFVDLLAAAGLLPTINIFYYDYNSNIEYSRYSGQPK